MVAFMIPFLQAKVGTDYKEQDADMILCYLDG